MTGAEYIAFLGAVAILVITPGPDTFLTLRFGARSLRAGLTYSVAAGLGMLVWAILALTGVAALLERFPDVRVVLTWVGGAFLVYLGVNALVKVRRALGAADAHRTRVAVAHPEMAVAGAPTAGAAGGTTSVEDTVTTVEAVEPVGTDVAAPAAPVEILPATPLRAVFRTGLISSLTNPKTGLFFLALLPPFLPAAPGFTDHLILLATVLVCMLAYSALLSVVARRVGRLLTRGRGPLVVDTVAGIMLILLGISIVLL